MYYEKLSSNKLYLDDLSYVLSLNFPWNKLKNSTVLISGATGMLGSMLIDVILLGNNIMDLNCSIIALSRSCSKLKKRFNYAKANFDKTLFLHELDINNPIELKNITKKIDYIIHLASNTHPVAYSTDPIGTILANIYGTKNLLDFCVKNKSQRFLFASSNEIYGENRGDVEFFSEGYCGYIDCNTLRAGYPESKRCGEALCQAYIKQYGVDVVISRLTRTYGPTLSTTDTKALTQFLFKALNNEDIVLKSEGNQFYSYTYAADALAGLFTVLFNGVSGEAYNIADEQSDIKLKDLAKIIANTANRKVVFELPNETEKAGFSKATKARLDATKLKKLGWKLHYPIKNGVERVFCIMENCKIKTLLNIKQ